MRSRAILLALLSASAAGAATFVVDSTADAVDALPGDGVCASAANDCTLRAAVQETNALGGADRIELPDGLYAIAAAGSGEDLAATGDLDVRDDLEIVGANESSTIVDGAALDRVLDLPPDAPPLTLRLRSFTVSGGRVFPFGIAGGCLRIPADGAVDLHRTTFRGCRGLDGGAIGTAGALTGSEVTFESNSGPEGSEQSGQGGAISNVGPGSSIALSRASFRGNRARIGGAIHSVGDFQQSARATITIHDSTFSGNDALQIGGAVLGNSSTDFLFENCTFSGNDAGSGGAIGNDGGCFIALHHCTIVGNTASMGGGISEVHFAPAFIELRNTILAGNQATNGPDCNLRLHSDGGSLIGDVTGCDPQLTPTDVVGLAPGLAPLAPAHPLDRFEVRLPLAGSPAIDAADPVWCAARDQRGLSRPHDGDGDAEAACDRGSVELAPGLLFHDGFEDGTSARWSSIRRLF